MLERQIEITNKKGLHARAAAKFINVAERYESDVLVVKDESEVNGKSILGLLMLAAHQGTMITIRVNGDDEKVALDGICGLIESKFEENE